MSWQTEEYWVGERMGALTYVRRYTRQGWYLVPKHFAGAAGPEMEWDWGADTTGAQQLAVAILFDAFQNQRLCYALGRAFMRGPIGMLQAPTWSYHLEHLLAWMHETLLARALETDVTRQPGWHLHRRPEGA